MVKAEGISDLSGRVTLSAPVLTKADNKGRKNQHGKR